MSLDRLQAMLSVAGFEKSKLVGLCGGLREWRVGLQDTRRLVALDGAQPQNGPGAVRLGSGSPIRIPCIFRRCRNCRRVLRPGEDVALLFGSWTLLTVKERGCKSPVAFTRRTDKTRIATCDVCGLPEAGDGKRTR